MKRRTRMLTLDGLFVLLLLALGVCAFFGGRAILQWQRAVAVHVAAVDTNSCPVIGAYIEFRSVADNVVRAAGHLNSGYYRNTYALLMGDYWVTVLMPHVAYPVYRELHHFDRASCALVLRLCNITQKIQIYHAPQNYWIPPSSDNGAYTINPHQF